MSNKDIVTGPGWYLDNDGDEWEVVPVGKRFIGVCGNSVSVINADGTFECWTYNRIVTKVDHTDDKAAPDEPPERVIQFAFKDSSQYGLTNRGRFACWSDFSEKWVVIEGSEELIERGAGMSNIPTEPGLYWYRQDKSAKWQEKRIYKTDGFGLCVVRGGMASTVSGLQGEWVPIPPPPDDDSESVTDDALAGHTIVEWRHSDNSLLADSPAGNRRRYWAADKTE